jgi:hypothetical protein
MGTKITEIKVFISSPADVPEEREICIRVISEINDEIGSYLRLHFKPIMYEEIPPETGEIQEIIKKDRPMKDIDILVGIMWCRMGTKTKNFFSGTEEEFADAYNLWSEFGYPHIMFFHNQSQPPKNVDRRQLKLVSRFVEDFSYKKAHPGLIKPYFEVDSFKKILKKSLIEYAFNFVEKEKSVDKNDDKFLNKHYINAGFQQIFLPEDAINRTLAKREDILNSKNIYLLAHAGYSFLVEYATRLYSEVEECLKNGGNFNIILTNPYCESGLFISLTDEECNALEKLNDIRQKNIDIINFIENSQWVKHKQNPAIQGYLTLKKKYPDNIHLKMLTYEMSATILFTDMAIYLEPYIIVDRTERGMTTFEMKISHYLQERGEAYLSKNLKDYFDFLWEMSEKYEDYYKNINSHKNMLKNKII